MTGLVIGHGNPWWLSPNVWVVPFNDFSQPSPGVLHPVVGQQYNCVANVSNTSQQTFPDANVYFYWANPSLGMITGVNANPIGSWSGGVDAGQPAVAFEYAPWTPSFVNNGHECIIANVVAGSVTGPAILDGANDPTVAQRNLGVVQLSPHMRGRFDYAFQVCNAARSERNFTIAAEAVPEAEAARILRSLGREPRKGDRHGAPEQLGLVRSRPAPAAYDTAHPVLEGVRLAPLTCTGFSLVGVLQEGMSLIHVTQTFEGRIVGGLSVLVLAEERLDA
jgi:hypothetical protein